MLRNYKERLEKCPLFEISGFFFAADCHFLSPGSICQLSVANVDDIRSAFVETLTSPKCRRRRTLAEKLAKGRLLC